MNILFQNLPIELVNYILLYNIHPTAVLIKKGGISKLVIKKVINRVEHFKNRICQTYNINKYCFEDIDFQKFALCDDLYINMNKEELLKIWAYSKRFNAYLNKWRCIDVYI